MNHAAARWDATVERLLRHAQGLRYDTLSPAVAEFPGLETFQSDLWYGFLAPAKTPPAIIDKLNAATRAAVQRAEVKGRIEPSGTVLIGNSPKEFAQIIRDDLARWGKVITVAKVAPEY